MKRKTKLKSIKIFDVVIWMLIIYWCGLIFSMSCQKANKSNGTSGGVCNFIARVFISDFEEMPETEQEEIIENMQFVVRKTAHFTAYGILGGLVALAFRRKTFKKRFLISLGLSFLYACSDEIHQLFVKGRSGEFRDVLIDSSGAIVGILFVCLIIYLINIKRLIKIQEQIIIN